MACRASPPFSRSVLPIHGCPHPCRVPNLCRDCRHRRMTLTWRLQRPNIRQTKGRQPRPNLPTLYCQLAIVLRQRPVSRFQRWLCRRTNHQTKTRNGFHSSALVLRFALFPQPSFLSGTLHKGRFFCARCGHRFLISFLLLRLLQHRPCLFNL